MSMTKKYIAAAVCMFGLSACGILQVNNQENSRIQFNYVTSNPEPTGIVQVFDIGANTVLQIKDIETNRPVFIAENGAEIPYSVMGQNAVLKGIHKSFKVVTNSGSSVVTRNDYMQITKATAKPSPIPTATPDVATKFNGRSAKSLRDEIERMRKEIDDLKAMIKAADQPTLQAHETTTITVPFANNSIAFTPKPIAKKSILNLASDARKISVIGYTDSFTASAIATKLAEDRALAAKAFMVSNGVSATKITVGYKPTGSFVADNRTKAGKAKNRRVEITIS